MRALVGPRRPCSEAGCLQLEVGATGRCGAHGGRGGARAERELLDWRVGVWLGELDALCREARRRGLDEDEVKARALVEGLDTARSLVYPLDESESM